MRPQPRPLSFVALFAGLLVARFLGAHFMAFFQHDEVAIAAGVAALLRDNGLADTYRYGPQAGYYYLVRLLDLALGGDPRNVPTIMTGVSALAGAAIPVCGLALFPFDLSRTERWSLAGLLAVNPILWMSSSYGNSAMPATALMVVALTLLGGHPRPALEALALAIFGSAVLVRADSVLAAPVLALLLHNRYGTIRAVALRSVPLALGLAAVYGVLFATDPRMASSVGGVADHLTNEWKTWFWEYLIWSTSPFILAIAIAGAVDLLNTRRRLLACLAAWVFPFFAFYFASTTLPRYFLPTVVPVSICAAAGVVMLVRALVPAWPRVVGAALGLLCSLHLFVGLGWFSPSSWRNVVLQAEFETQAGPMWTGALLHKTYLVPGLLVRSVRHAGFDRVSGTQRGLDGAFSEAARAPAPGYDVLVLLAGWNMNAYHYYANVHGARYVSKSPGPIFLSPTRMKLASVRLTSMARRTPEYRQMTELPLDAGAQIWMLGWDIQSEAELRTRLPSGMRLESRGDSTGRFRRWVVRSALP